jgi:outer membrane protein TolC
MITKEKTMRNIKIFLAIILIMGLATLTAEEKRNNLDTKQSSEQEVIYRLLSLTEAQALTLEHNKLIKESDSKAEAAKQTKKSLFTNYLPKLEVTANYLLRSESTEMTLEGGYLPTYDFNPSTNQLDPNLYINPQTNQPVYGSDGNPIFNQYALFPDKDLEILPKSGFTSGISLKQPIFTGGKITSAYKMGSLGEKASQLNLQYTKQNVLFATEQAYWRVVSLDQKTKVTEKYLNLVDKVLAKVQDGYDVGMVNKNQLLQAKVKYNEVALLNSEAQNGLELATMALAQQIGLSLNTKILPADSLVNISDKLNLSDFSAANYEERFDYQMLKLKQKVADLKINLSRSEFLPQIGIVASYNYLSYELNDINHDDFNVNAMAQFSLPIFQWGESIYKVNEAKALYKEETYYLENASEMMKLQINQSLSEVENKIVKLTLAESSLAQADEYLKVETDNYEVGMITLTDLLNAQSQWQKTYSDYIDSLLELNIAHNELAKNCGKYDFLISN